MSGANRQFRSADAARKRVRSNALRPLPYRPPRLHRRDVVIDVERRHGWTVYRVRPRDAQPDSAVVYAHGGGWVNPMTPMHWHFVAHLAAEADTTFVVPIYPLIPFGTAAEVVDGFVDIVLETTKENARVSIAGDSAGGQIALSTALELRDRHGVTLHDTIMLSPALDLRFENPEIPEVQPRDPLLGVPGTRYFAELWRGDLPITDPRVSPLFGDLRGLGRLLVFCGTDEIIAPDVHILAAQAHAAGTPFELHEKPGQFHVYPLIPTPAGRKVRRMIVDRLQS